MMPNMALRDNSHRHGATAATDAQHPTLAEVRHFVFACPLLPSYGPELMTALFGKVGPSASVGNGSTGGFHIGCS